MIDTQLSKPLVLFVDDMPDVRELFAAGVEFYDPPFRAAFAEDVEGALRIVRDEHPAAVVMDFNLIGETGIDLAEKLHDYYPDIRKAVLTGYDMSMTNVNAHALGMEVWAKPVKAMPDLIDLVMALLASPPPAGREADGTVLPRVVRALAATIGILTGSHIHRLH
jgi:ActR/RegA family two-component response regulator